MGMLIEYAKSSRSTCKNCNLKIEKEKIRIGIEEPGRGGFDLTKW